MCDQLNHRFSQSFYQRWKELRHFKKEIKNLPSSSEKVLPPDTEVSKICPDEHLPSMWGGK